MNLLKDNKLSDKFKKETVDLAEIYTLINSSAVNYAKKW